MFQNAISWKGTPCKEFPYFQSIVTVHWICFYDKVVYKSQKKKKKKKKKTLEFLISFSELNVQKPKQFVATEPPLIKPIATPLIKNQQDLP